MVTYMTIDAEMKLIFNREVDTQLFNLTITLIDVLSDIKVDGRFICKQAKLDATATNILKRGVKNTHSNELMEFCNNVCELVKLSSNSNIGYVPKNFYLSHEELDFINKVIRNKVK